MSMPMIWKEALKKEIDCDFLYQWYTSSTGFQTVKRSIEAYENFLFSKGNVFFKSNTEVCMTIGASQAAFYSVSYLHSIGCKKMLLVGMNYPLYERIGKKYGYGMVESRSELDNRIIPTINELTSDIEQHRPDVIVFTYPNNPSGENYSDEEFDYILKIINRHKLYCIVDCVCNMMISAKGITTPEFLISKNDMTEKCIIVNSFSKTDSAPGFRVGYLLGNSELIKFASSQQADCIMNPQTIPVIPIWITLLFRCLHLSEWYGHSKKQKEKLIRFFRSMFFVTTAISPKSIRLYVNELVNERLWSEYSKYVAEMLEKEANVANNYAYTCSRLEEFIIGKTNLQSGFNFLIKLRPFFEKSELGLCKDLIEKTGIAVLTESAFSLKESTSNDYWVRISLAANSKLFMTTIDNLYLYLKNMEVDLDDK
jgi:aspartate/methionine/tyrosine aminotransferase